MSKRKTLSLLIPAYNAARFLPRLLGSAAAQTEPFDEIWVYDDCSTDNTREVAEAHGAKVLAGDINRGCSVGKNRLAAAVETDWIHFHDADDALLPNFVALARTWIERNDKDVVLFDYEYREDKTSELLSVVRFDKTALETDPCRYAISRIINPFCGLYRRSALLSAGGYDEDPLVLFNEDSAFHIGLAFAGCRFSAESAIAIVNYRVNHSMSAANQVKCACAQFHVMRKTRARNGSQDYWRDISRRLWSISGTLCAYSEWQTAREAAKLASMLGPPDSSVGQPWFRALAAFDPASAVVLREHLVRRFRPHLRQT